MITTIQSLADKLESDKFKLEKRKSNSCTHRDKDNRLTITNIICNEYKCTQCNVLFSMDKFDPIELLNNIYSIIQQIKMLTKSNKISSTIGIPYTSLENVLYVYHILTQRNPRRREDFSKKIVGDCNHRLSDEEGRELTIDDIGNGLSNCTQCNIVFSLNNVFMSYNELNKMCDNFHSIIHQIYTITDETLDDPLFDEMNQLHVWLQDVLKVYKEI